MLRPYVFTRDDVTARAVGARDEVPALVRELAVRLEGLRVAVRCLAGALNALAFSPCLFTVYPSSSSASSLRRTAATPAVRLRSSSTSFSAATEKSVSTSSTRLSLGETSAFFVIFVHL